MNDAAKEAMRLRGIYVGEQLMGSSQALADVCTEEEHNNQTFCNALDDVVFLCDSCGWWVEAGEIEDGECTECHNPEGNE